MGFTKIYKQTMPLFSSQYANPTMPVVEMNGSLSYKDWTGATHTGFVVSGYVGSSTPYYSYLGRNALLAQMSLSNEQVNSFVLPTTQQPNSSNMNTYIAFGSGDSAESEDSYHLDSPYTYVTDFRASYASSVVSYDPDTDKTYVSRAITISAINDMTIKEIGLYTPIWESRSTGTSYQWTPPVLMYRKVLSTPISLLAGQSVTLDLKISGG